MRAVNLVPADQRRGAGGAAGRAGGVAYVVVGLLVVLVAMGVIYAVATRQVADRKSKVATVSAQADAVQVQAQALQPYVAFATISQQRRQAVVLLANARFDWSGAMDQIARALPANVTLTSLSGGSSGVSATAAGLPGAGPSFTFAACGTSHPNVAQTLVALRKIAGVLNVSLSASQKTGTTSGTGASTGAASSSGGGGAGGCRSVSFNGVVTFAASFTVGTPASLAQHGPVPASAHGAGSTSTAVVR